MSTRSKPRHFPPPWRDRNYQTLAYVYFEDEAGQRSAAARLLIKDEARRIAANIAKLPEFLKRAKHHTAGAVEGAVARLTRDLCRDGVICEPATFHQLNGVALAVSSSKDG